MKLTRAIEQIFSGAMVALLIGIFSTAVRTRDSVLRIEEREASRDKRDELTDLRLDRLELMCRLKPTRGEIPWQESKKQKRL